MNVLGFAFVVSLMASAQGDAQESFVILLTLAVMGILFELEKLA